MSAAARLAAIPPLAFAASAIAARAVLLHPRGAVAAGLAQPLGVVTNWHAAGAALLALLGAAIAASAFAYVRAMDCATPGDAPALLLGTLAALAAAWLWPAIFSSDVYAYAAYGEMARTGIGAYSHAILPGGDAIFDAAVWQWGNPPPACVYGPAFVAAADAVVSLTARFGAAAALDALRALSSFALLAAGALAYVAYPGDRRARLVAAIVISANPVSIWCAAEGHNDALALCVAFAGFALARKNAAAGAALTALSGTVKAPGLLAAVPAGLRDWRSRAGGAIGAAATVALSIPLLRAVTTQVAPSGHYAPQASLQAVFAFFPPLAIGAALAAGALLARGGLRCIARGEREGWVRLALAGWVLVPNPYPWYGIWLLAASAAAPRSRAALVAIALSFTAQFRYAPDAIGAPNEPLAIALGVAATLPLLWMTLPNEKKRAA